MLWWDNDLATGMKRVDEQHKAIFEKTGEIFGLDVSTDERVINKAFGFLMNYAVNHFNEEEQAMVQYGYEDFEEHKEEHAYFIEELFKISNEVKKAGISEDALDSLKVLVIEWLGNHITESDKKFAKAIVK